MNLPVRTPTFACSASGRWVIHALMPGENFTDRDSPSYLPDTTYSPTPNAWSKSTTAVTTPVSRSSSLMYRSIRRMSSSPSLASRPVGYRRSQPYVPTKRSPGVNVPTSVEARQRSVTENVPLP